METKKGFGNLESVKTKDRVDENLQEGGNKSTEIYDACILSAVLSCIGCQTCSYKSTDDEVEVKERLEDEFENENCLINK